MYLSEAPGKGNRERVREEQRSKGKWQKVLSRIKEILAFPDLKCTHRTEIDR